MKNSLFDSLFSNESIVFFHRFHSPFEKVPFMALYSRKIGVLGNPQMIWDLFQTKFNVENLSFPSLKPSQILLD